MHRNPAYDKHDSATCSLVHFRAPIYCCYCGFYKLFCSVQLGSIQLNSVPIIAVDVASIATVNAAASFATSLGGRRAIL